MAIVSNLAKLNSAPINSNTIKYGEFQKATNSVKIANGAGVLTGIAAQELWMLVAPVIGIKLITPTKTANPYSASKINYISPERDAFEKGLLKYFDTIPPRKASKKDLLSLEKWLKTADYNTNSASVVESAKIYVKQAKAAQAQAGSVFKADKGGSNQHNSGNSDKVDKKNGGGKKPEEDKKPRPEDDPEYDNLISYKTGTKDYIKQIEEGHLRNLAELKSLQAELEAIPKQNYNAFPTNSRVRVLSQKISDLISSIQAHPDNLAKMEKALLSYETKIINYLTKFNSQHGISKPVLKLKPQALPRPPRPKKSAP